MSFMRVIFVRPMKIKIQRHHQSKLWSRNRFYWVLNHQWGGGGYCSKFRPKFVAVTPGSWEWELVCALMVTTGDSTLTGGQMNCPLGPARVELDGVDCELLWVEFSWASSCDFARSICCDVCWVSCIPSVGGRLWTWEFCSSLCSTVVLKI